METLWRGLLVGHTTIESKMVGQLTEVPSYMALSLELLYRDFRACRKEKNVPILVPHCRLRRRILYAGRAAEERFKLVGGGGERPQWYAGFVSISRRQRRMDAREPNRKMHLPHQAHAVALFRPLINS